MPEAPEGRDPGGIKGPRTNILPLAPSPLWSNYPWQDPDAWFLYVPETYWWTLDGGITGKGGYDRGTDERVWWGGRGIGYRVGLPTLSSGYDGDAAGAGPTACPWIPVGVHLLSESMLCP